MKNLGAGSIRLILVAALAVGCAADSGGGLESDGVQLLDASAVAADSGSANAECPKPDGGVVQLTRRGCPLTIDYAIR